MTNEDDDGSSTESDSSELYAAVRRSKLHVASTQHTQAPFTIPDALIPAELAPLPHESPPSTTEPSCVNILDLHAALQASGGVAAPAEPSAPALAAPTAAASVQTLQLVPAVTDLARIPPPEPAATATQAETQAESATMNSSQLSCAECTAKMRLPIAGAASPAHLTRRCACCLRDLELGSFSATQRKSIGLHYMRCRDCTAMGHKVVGPRREKFVPPKKKKKMQKKPAPQVRLQRQQTLADSPMQNNCPESSVSSNPPRAAAVQAREICMVRRRENIAKAASSQPNEHSSVATTVPSEPQQRQQPAGRPAKRAKIANTFIRSIERDVTRVHQPHPARVPPTQAQPWSRPQSQILGRTMTQHIVTWSPPSSTHEAPSHYFKYPAPPLPGTRFPQRPAPSNFALRASPSPFPPRSASPFPSRPTPIQPPRGWQPPLPPVPPPRGWQPPLPPFPPSSTLSVDEWRIPRRKM